MEVSIFDLQFSEQEIQTFQNGAKKILQRGFLTNDLFVEKFEKDFSRWVNSSSALAICNGTSAIEVALRATGVQGKEVFIPTNTFIATAQAAIRAGGIPRFVDVESNFFGTCPKDLSEKLERSKNPGAILHVHIGSHVSDHFKEIIDISTSHKIPLIEDACQALGAQWKGKQAGTFGDFGCFSFFTTKNMTTGEGGMVISSNTPKEYLISLRQFGMNKENFLFFDTNSGNFKMNEFSALLGVMELKRVNQRIQKRRLLAKRYQENLKQSPFRCIEDSPWSSGSYYKQMIIAPQEIQREKLHKFLKLNRVSLTGGVYYNPLHRQPSMKMYLEGDEFPVADYFADFHFCPPCYPELDINHVDFVCEKLLEFSKENSV